MEFLTGSFKYIRSSVFIDIVDYFRAHQAEEEILIFPTNQDFLLGI